MAVGSGPVGWVVAGRVIQNLEFPGADGGTVVNGVLRISEWKASTGVGARDSRRRVQGAFRTATGKVPSGYAKTRAAKLSHR